MTNGIKTTWRKVKLGELADITSSKRIYLSDYVKRGIPFFRSKEIIEKHENQKNSTELYISEEKFEKIKEKFGAPVENDLLLTSVGTIGIPYLVKKEDYFYFKDGNLIWFRDFRDCDPKFIYYWLESRFGKEAVNSITIGSSQSAITIIGLKNLEIFIPEDIDEQKRIADILSAFDDKIELNNKIIKTLEEMTSAIFKEWFVKFRFPGWEKAEFVDSELGEIPKGWEVSKIGKELKTILGGTPSTTNRSYWESGNIPWMNSGAINDFPIINPTSFITEKGLKNSAAKLMPTKTVVLPLVISIEKPVNISILGREMSGNQSVVGIIGDNRISPEYIYYWVKYRKEEIYGSASGGAQQHINKNVIDSFIVLIPINEILNSFKKKVEPSFDAIIKKALENQTLSSLRDLLLPKLMSGKVRV